MRLLERKEASILNWWLQVGEVEPLQKDHQVHQAKELGVCFHPRGEAQSVRRMAYWELLALGQGLEQMHQGTVRCQVW